MIFEKLVVLDSVIFFPEHRERLERLARRIVEYNTCTDEDQVSERCRGADGIISCWVDISHRIIDENPQLKAIAFWTHDFEHRIDANYAKDHGIHVPAIPDYGTDSVAELVFLGLLGLLKGGVDAETEREEEIVFRIGDDVRRLSANVEGHAQRAVGPRVRQDRPAPHRLPGRNPRRNPQGPDRRHPGAAACSPHVWWA